MIPALNKARPPGERPTHPVGDSARHQRQLVPGVLHPYSTFAFHIDALSPLRRADQKGPTANATIHITTVVFSSATRFSSGNITSSPLRRSRPALTRFPTTLLASLLCNSTHRR